MVPFESAGARRSVGSCHMAAAGFLVVDGLRTGRMGRWPEKKEGS